MKYAKYTKDFIDDVLSVVRDANIKENIINGKIDIGDFLSINAFKGIDSRIIIDCLEKRDLDYLKDLACNQERIKALYQEWFEYYIMKNGPTLKQKAIEEELNLQRKK